MSGKTRMFHIVVVSDKIASGQGEDISGSAVEKMLLAKGFKVDKKEVVGNNYKDIVRVLRSSQSKVLIFLGGTGPSPRDITIDVIEKAAWRKIPGFGELFRIKSFEKIGYSAVLSRSELFVLYDGRVAVALPGSVDAATLGTEILTNLIEHLVDEANRFEGEHKKQR